MSLHSFLHRRARTFERTVTGLLLAAGFVVSVAPAHAQAPAAPPAPAAGAPAPQGGRQGGALRGGYTEAATLPVRIMDFKADRLSIKPGETITLSWQVENPGGRGAAPGSAPVSIAPSIGRVVPLGQMKVIPKATTTYTLTANGNNGPVSRTLTITVAGTKAAAAADEPATGAQPTPRALDGKPDLTGVYGYNATPGGRGAPPPAAMSGDLPRTPTLKPGAEKYRVVRGPTDTGLYATCRPPGVPQTFLVPYYMQIVQSPKYVVILHEYLSLPRIIEIGGELPADPDPFYMGHSVGRWEGDVLVVESIGFKESEVSNIKTTESLKITERFRRPNLGTLEYEAVIDDPNVFATPWLMQRTFPFLPEHKRVDEFYCENNRDYKDLFGGK